MKIGTINAALIAASLAFSAAAEARDASVDAGLSTVQREWATAAYEAHGKKARKAAFEALLEDAAALSEKYPREAEVLAWQGIALSTYAGEVGGMSAMKYAKAARELLHRAEALEPTALAGGIYASLGALYSKVPGGLIGFGDDELAEEYFRKALAVDPDSIDANYFYGEFLLERGDYDQALDVLEHALKAPGAVSRPVFDAGRRAIRSLITQASAKAGG